MNKSIYFCNIFMFVSFQPSIPVAVFPVCITVPANQMKTTVNLLHVNVMDVTLAPSVKHVSLIN